MSGEKDSMPKNREKQLLSIVNASGFLFQPRVADEIYRDSPMHGWYVASFEHPWEDKDTGEQGYADMVLKNQTVTAWRMVIECKRPRDASWVFLVPDFTGERIRNGRCLCTYKGPKATWYDLVIQPGSHEAFFCAIRGKGEGDAPMLERLSTQLLSAVDALAVQEMRLDKLSGIAADKLRLYFPAIVITAKLVVCLYDPATISLDRGEIKNGTFKEVPLVRFKKSLSTDLESVSGSGGFEKVAKGLERTVFVIQASSLSDVLRKWSIENKPWVS